MNKHKFSSGTADINLPLHQVLGYILRQILDWNLSLVSTYCLICSFGANLGIDSLSPQPGYSVAAHLTERTRSDLASISVCCVPMAIVLICTCRAVNGDPNSPKRGIELCQGVGGLEVSPRPPQLFLDTIITTANGW
ncbi:hypothetical protein PIIN_10259 [Serendipita indica DSM 11827]|uniref:Uncharacterized protein n=1 Tax=Serendipita indica (strain DSM 11827) TaxID=1109443 RepID=G4TY71_SERID|nr:hypothetical protein PIIN_10259 [Serendipita indica DSM 11827]